MEKEEAILALAALGVSKAEIDEFIRVEVLRRKNKEDMQKRLQAAEIVKDMTL